jgi:Protein of unknown function (DUF2442)
LNGLMGWNRQEGNMLVQNDQYPELMGVLAVKPLDDLHAHGVFTDGSARDLDLDPYLHSPIFEPIRRSPKLFAAVYVDADSDTLTWPNGANIDPDVLYYYANPPWATELTLRSALPRLTTDAP